MQKSIQGNEGSTNAGLDPGYQYPGYQPWNTQLLANLISVPQTSARLHHLVAGEVNLCKSDLLGPLLRY
jgi:hypothetical protein